jgi:hypothetical protein
VKSAAGLYKNKYLCEAVPRAGLNRVFWSVKACSIYLSVFGIVSHHILWLWVSWGKKRLVGILKNGMLCFVFQNACQKVTLNKVPSNVTQIFEAGFYV